MQVITHPEFDKIPFIKYGFCTRKGGVSEGLYSSLNINRKGDDPKNVKANEEIIAKYFGLESSRNLIRPAQKHTADVAILLRQEDLKPFQSDNIASIPVYDASVTNLKGVLIGVSTADCTPILFVDEVNKIIGATHAGWKGARYGVIEATAKAMVSIGAEQSSIKALIGPCIRQKSYEVDDGFLKNFLEEAETNRKFFIPSKNPNHYMFDMAGYVKEKLLKEKIGSVYDVGLDTYSDKERFFSYRRNCLEEKTEVYGTQFNCIILI